jgi:hypothetical protein
LPVAALPLPFHRRSFPGSLIGGPPETQEMLAFCGEHYITCDIEMIRMEQINEAYERMLKSDVKYRFVIDMKSLCDGDGSLRAGRPSPEPSPAEHTRRPWSAHLITGGLGCQPVHTAGRGGAGWRLLAQRGGTRRLRRDPAHAHSAAPPRLP